MYFYNYKDFQNAKLNQKLLWEYDLENFNYDDFRNIVVQRVIERGWHTDWYFILNYYGIKGVKEAIMEISYLNNKDMNFVSIVFEIPLNQLKCYTKKQLKQQHWSS
jgi:hypothetical protein